MVFAPLLLLPYSLSSQALSAQTSSVIQGTAPYLTFDDGATKETTIESLLSITLSDGTKITPETNDSETTPIVLPNASETLADVNMLVPPSTNSIGLDAIIGFPNNYWRDDDGDGQGVNGVTITGSLTVAITDKNNQVVNRTDTLDICNAPYKMVLSSIGGSLTTQYGVPNSSTFSGNTVAYYINPNLPPKVCYARPNLIYGKDNENGWGVNFAGPANIWNSDNGFLIQSTNPSSYALNFPTTGADGLYFDLIIAGVDANQLTWSTITHEGITATVTRVTANDNWLSNGSEVVTRVTLIGPKASNAQIEASSPSSLSTPNLPQMFELVGYDSRGNAVVKYGFELKQWFVNRGSKDDTTPNQATWCGHLGYRLPKVKDLTNAVCTGLWAEPDCQGAVGATPLSSGNHYQRRIGSGFFTEWGYINFYAGAVVTSHDRYWVSDVAGRNNQFYISSYNGHVNSRPPSYNNYGICSYP